MAEKMLTILGSVLALTIVILLVFITIGIWKPLIGDPALLGKVAQVVSNQGNVLQQQVNDIQGLKQDIQMMKKLTAEKE